MKNSNPNFVSRNPREQYNNKNIQQYISLATQRRSNGVEVSARPAFGPEAAASQPSAQDSVFSTPKAKGERGSVISPRELYSRWSGISVHHVKSKKGVKIGITLQKAEWTSVGRTLQITAELKRSDRLREVKSMEDDSAEFVLYIDQIKQELREARDKSACLGRAHQRGARKAWIQDIVVLAYLKDNIVDRVLLHIEGEDHIIILDQPMSELQSKVYHSTGYHNKIVLKKRSPKLDDLPTTQYGG